MAKAKALASIRKLSEWNAKEQDKIEGYLAEADRAAKVRQKHHNHFYKSKRIIGFITSVLLKTVLGGLQERSKRGWYNGEFGKATEER